MAVAMDTVLKWVSPEPVMLAKSVTVTVLLTK